MAKFIVLLAIYFLLGHVSANLILRLGYQNRTKFKTKAGITVVAIVGCIGIFAMLLDREDIPRALRIIWYMSAMFIGLAIRLIPANDD